MAAAEISNLVHALAILRRESTADPFTFKFNVGFRPTITPNGTGQIILELTEPLGNPDDDVWNGMAFAQVRNLAAGWANTSIDSAQVAIQSFSAAGAAADVLTLYVYVLRMPTTD